MANQLPEPLHFEMNFSNCKWLENIQIISLHRETEHSHGQMCKLDRVEQRGIVDFDLTNVVTSVRPGYVPFKTAPYGSGGDK